MGETPSFLPFYFRVRALSIQRTQLSRSLEEARPMARPVQAEIMSSLSD